MGHRDLKTIVVEAKIPSSLGSPAANVRNTSVSRLQAATTIFAENAGAIALDSRRNAGYG
jgi:hypothetical protein